MRLGKLMAIVSMAVSMTSVSAYAATYMIGDDDGYGIDIPNNGQHPFNGNIPNHDGRSDAEKLATNGAQFTDTYSTTQPGYSPQDGTVAAFIFSGLGANWVQGSLEFDMADFQAIDQFGGAVIASFNGVVQNWAFVDGFPNTVVRTFDLEQAVLDSINNTGELVITIDRHDVSDFYGFDYVKLSGANAVSNVPLPAAFWLFASAMTGVLAVMRRKSN